MNNAYETLINEIEKLYEKMPKMKVLGVPKPDEIRNYLQKNYDFQNPIDLNDLIMDVSGMFKKWLVQVTHPRYFGYFNPSVFPAGIAADTLVAAYNHQLAVWSQGQAAVEIEQHILKVLMTKIGYDPDTSVAHFTSGGSEANFTAVISALTHIFPDYGSKGLRGVNADPMIYVAETAHDSFSKICHMSGLGRNQLREIKVDEDMRLDLNDLKIKLSDDRLSGARPLMIVGTAGSTASGIIDPLVEIAGICRDCGAWFHVDAAWGGTAVLSNKLKGFFKGIELSDSITWDAHKWLNVPMGAGMYFSRNSETSSKAFRVTTDYMPDSTVGAFEPYLNSMQWSRRFIGLKVFMTFANIGLQGYEEIIDRQVGLAQYLRKSLSERGWSILNKSHLPVVCFNNAKIRDGSLSPDDILKEIYKRGEVWISQIAMPGGIKALRACVTSYRATKSDIDVLVGELSGYE